MEEKIVTPGLKKTYSFKVKIQWKNGSSETIYSLIPPNVNPVTPMFMDFKIKDGYMRHVSMLEIRSMDIEVIEDSRVNLIV